MCSQDFPQDIPKDIPYIACIPYDLPNIFDIPCIIYIYTLFYGSPGPFHQFPLIKSDSCAPSQCEAGSSRCSDAREAAGAGNGPNLMKALVMNIMVN